MRIEAPESLKNAKELILASLEIQISTISSSTA
jgi:hypothetical protein